MSNFQKTTLKSFGISFIIYFIFFNSMSFAGNAHAGKSSSTNRERPPVIEEQSLQIHEYIEETRKKPFFTSLKQNFINFIRRKSKAESPNTEDNTEISVNNTDITSSNSPGSTFTSETLETLGQEVVETLISQEESQEPAIINDNSGENGSEHVLVENQQAPQAQEEHQALQDLVIINDNSEENRSEHVSVEDQSVDQRAVTHDAAKPVNSSNEPQMTRALDNKKNNISLDLAKNIALTQKIEESEKIEKIAQKEAEVLKINYVSEHVETYNPSIISSAMLDNTMQALSNTLSIRLESFAKISNSTGLSTGGTTGVASGEDSIESGVWIKAFNSNTKQSLENSDINFKTNQRGVVVGIDAQFYDNFIAGIAYTRTYARSKFNNFSDQQSSYMHIGAVYAEYNVSPKFLIHSYLQYALANIKHKVKSELFPVKSETTANIFRASIEASYSYNIGGFILTPKFGTTFDYFDMKKYTEKTNNFNIEIPNRRGKKISVNPAISLRKPLLYKSINIVPEVHFGLDHIIHNVKSKSLIRLSTPEILHIVPSKPVNADKTTYNIGTYASASKSDNCDFGIGYDYSFRKGFSNHLTYANFSVKF